MFLMNVFNLVELIQNPKGPSSVMRLLSSHKSRKYQKIMAILQSFFVTLGSWESYTKVTNGFFLLIIKQQVYTSFNCKFYFQSFFMSIPNHVRGKLVTLRQSWGISDLQSALRFQKSIFVHSQHKITIKSFIMTL